VTEQDVVDMNRRLGGDVITAYALAIVGGGPILTLWLARFEKRKVLIGLMALFIAGNLIGAFTTSYSVLLISRVIAGLTHWRGRGDRSLRSRAGAGSLSAFRDRNLIASLAITALGWAGFITLYGYIAPVAGRIAGFSASDLTWVLVIVGLGLVIGNTLGGRTADANLRLSLILWPAAMIVSLIVVGFVEQPREN
jgi:predicted MFS family arabinose efflux permease